VEFELSLPFYYFYLQSVICFLIFDIQLTLTNITQLAYCSISDAVIETMYDKQMQPVTAAPAAASAAAAAADDDDDDDGMARALPPEAHRDEHLGAATAAAAAIGGAFDQLGMADASRAAANEVLVHEAVNFAIKVFSIYQ